MRELIITILFAITLPASALYAEVQTYNLPHNVQEFAYKDGALYYNAKIAPNNFGLFKFVMSTRSETTIKSFSADSVSPAVINDNGDIYYITLSNGYLSLNCINQNSTKEWHFQMTPQCYASYSSKLFTPLIIDEKSVIAQSSCGDIFLINDQGQKIRDFHIASGLSLQPVKIEKNKMITGNNFTLYSVDIPDVIIQQIPSPGNIPQAPDLKDSSKPKP